MLTPSRRIRGFILISALLVATSAGWAIVRYQSHADDREAWRALNATMAGEQARIDSLECAIGTLSTQLEGGGRSLGTMAERIGHLERSASGDHLPRTTYRSYRQTIDRHNAVVERHNTLVAEQRRVHDEYAATIERYNILVDSANRLQRAAVQEGYGLPDEGSAVGSTC